MKLTEKPFEKIADGTKIIESRLFDSKRQSITIEDTIEFTQNGHPENTVMKKVVALYRYPLFSYMFLDFPPEYFGGTSRESLLAEIEQYYSRAEQEKFGVIGIKIENVS